MSPVLSLKHSSTNFDTLPFDIRLLILCKTASLQTFKSLILSCSAYYKPYCAARKQVLWALICRVCGNDGIVVQLPYLAAVKSSKGVTTAPGYNGYKKEVVKAFLDDASEEEDEDSSLDVTAEDCIKLLGLYRDATLISEDLYTSSLSRRLQREHGQQPEDKQSMSQTERSRIKKAIYRWELWSQLFATHRPAISPRQPSSPSKVTAVENISAKDQVILFLARYAPWEQEQLGCLCDYAMRRYTALLDEGAKFFAAEGDQQRLEETGIKDHQKSGLSFLLQAGGSDYTSRNKRRDSLMAHGPTLMAQILRAEDLRQRCWILVDYIQVCDDDGPSLPDLMLRSYASEAADPSLKATIGSVTTELPPPYGWRWAKEEDSDSSDNPFPQWSHTYLAPWGYVFWDEARFHEWDFVIESGKYKYNDEDPGVDDVGFAGICERETGREIEMDRDYWGVFAEQYA